MQLFGDDSDAEEEKLQVNEKFAEAYEARKRKQALDKAKEQGLDDLSGDESSSSDEDSDAELLTKKLSMQVAQTIHAIRSKDPSIYSDKTSFFDEDSDSEEDEEQAAERQRKKKKPYLLKDHLRDEVLASAKQGDDGEEVVPVVQTHAEEMEDLKRGFLDAASALEGGKAEKKKKKKKKADDESDSDDDEGDMFAMKKKQHTTEELEEQEEEFADFVKEKGAKENKSSAQNEKKALKRFYEESASLNPTEKFLWEYIQNDGWTDQEDKKAGLVDEDSEQEDKEDEFERSYNFRFEEEGQGAGVQVATHARTTANSVRRKDDSRKRKRKERDERKAAEKAKKVEELKRLKNLKKAELVDKIKQLKDVAGADGAAFENVDLDSEWDPDAHEKAMDTAFDEDYYEGTEEDKEKFMAEMKAEMEQEADVAGDWGDENEETWWGEGEEEGAEGYDEQEPSKSKKERKRKSKKDKVDLGEYIDKYYELDYEDIVGGMPTRFKYTQVAPTDCGLTAEEILLLPDKTLNQFASLKAYAPYRDDSSKMGKRYTPRRWEHHKLQNGVNDELNSIYAELQEKGGAPQAQKGAKKGAKETSRDNRRREYAEELKNSAKDSGGKKIRKERQPDSSSGAVSSDRMALYGKKKDKKDKKDKKFTRS